MNSRTGENRMGSRALNRGTTARGLVCAAACVALSCTNSASTIQGNAQQPTSVYSVTVVANTAQTLPKCTASLTGTTALVQTPLTLYSCQAGAWISIPCASILAGAVAYASASQTLIACVSGRWSVVSLPPGPQGTRGPTGATGMTGQTGAQGPAGASGPGGDAGASSLVVQLPVPSGASCPNGGTEVENGIDRNGDGQLQASEVVTISYVCNGIRGDSGVAGPQGPVGPSGALANVTPEPPGANCATGGERVGTGVDLNGNGVLDADEVTGTTYVCNGVAAPLTTGVCRADDACESGQCLGGYCCATVCDTGNATCGATACTPEGACTYPKKGLKCGSGPSCTGSTLTTHTCSGSGECGTTVAGCGQDLACASATSCFFSCSDDSQCAAGFTCNFNHCVGAVLPGGDGCSIDADCASGICDLNFNTCCASSTPCPGPAESQCSIGASEFGDAYCTPGTGACGVLGEGQRCTTCAGGNSVFETCGADGHCDTGAVNVNGINNINGGCSPYVCAEDSTGASTCVQSCFTGLSPCGCKDNSGCASGFVCVVSIDNPPQPCGDFIGLECECIPG